MGLDMATLRRMDVGAPIPNNPAAASATPVWRFDWLTRGRCRAIFIALTLLGAVGQIVYLHHSPIDLSGDEAHYWDWSRRLDLSYYSKGPLVAYIIRASCAIFGNNAPAVRYPAIVLAVLTCGLIYLLTLKLFKSDRLALGVTVLCTLVPIFIAGSMLMTIDPPFFFCWAMATYLVSFAIFDRKQWAWPAAGLFIGIGFLAKFAALLWLPGVLLFLLMHRPSRPLFKTAGPWVMIVVALLCTTPVVVWNVKHDWVSVRHVARQTGMTDDSDNDADDLNSPSHTWKEAFTRVGAFAGGQVAVLGPVVVFMIGGTVYAFGRRSKEDPNRAALQLLTTIGGFILFLTFLDTFRSKVQLNWPAPAYFSLIIVAGYFFSLCLADRRWWRLWRGWGYGTVIFGLMLQPIVRDFSVLYPLVRQINPYVKSPIALSRLDPTVKLRGWKQLGQRLGEELSQLPPGSFILCDDYQQTAETAFYTPGNPVTYYAGSYFKDPKRHTQYDIWPDRSLTPPNPLIGRDAIYVGKGGGIPPEVKNAFAKYEPLPDLDIIVDGVKIRMFRPYRCTGFKGMARPTNISDY